MGIDPERRRRPRRATDNRATLRRLTVAAAVAAAGLNAALFAETGIGHVGPAEVQRTISSIVNAFFPGAALQPPAQAPSPSPRAVVTTGGS
jgi:hypothetical protein